jgi:peptide/nickel transport system substrate-binding protein
MSQTLIIAQSRVFMEEPHNCTDAKDVLNTLSAFFDPLVAYDAQMNYVPALATSWQVSDDARTWTFNLRPDVTFHNGQPVDAEAVAYSLARMARPDMGVTLGAPGVYNQYMAGMALKVIDRHTVKISLAEPMADLLDVLVTGYILPPDAVEKLGPDFKYEPVGTGPYRFVEYKQGEEGGWLRAKKNEAYFGTAPKYDAIEWRMIPDPQQRLQMIADGHAHIATGPPYTTSLDEPFDYVCSRGTTAYILIFNAASKFLKDPRVRTAINMGVDRAALIENVLNGAGYPLNGFISPVHLGCDTEDSGFAYDPVKAKSLLAEAGYGNGLHLTLDSPTSMPNEAVRLSEVLAEQLNEIGVEIDIVYTEDREHYANKVRLKDIHDLCVFDSSPLSTFRVLKEKVDSRFEGSWWQGYANGEVENLIDLAQTTVDNKRREALFKQCYQQLKKDPPWLYLYNYINITCTSSDLSGWKPPVHNIIDPRYL